jgi:hypothetical protein
MPSFARTVRNLQRAETDPSSVTLSSQIDKQCLKITDCFDTTIIAAKLQELIKIAKFPRFNRDKFFKCFFELYDTVYAPDARAKGYFHASSLENDCERRLFYEISKVKASDMVSRDISPQLQRIFDVGTWWHTYIQLQLLKAGILDKAEVPVVSELSKINSRADGIITWQGKKMLLEIKSMNAMMFAKALVRPFPKHEYQASIYAKELGLEWICFIYVNKDTSAIKEFIIPVNEALIKEPYRKMRRVLNAVDRTIVPDRECPNKFSDVALQCPYCTHCFSTKN